MRGSTLQGPRIARQSGTLKVACRLCLLFALCTGTAAFPESLPSQTSGSAFLLELSAAVTGQEPELDYIYVFEEPATGPGRAGTPCRDQGSSSGNRASCPDSYRRASVAAVCHHQLIPRSVLGDCQGSVFSHAYCMADPGARAVTRESSACSIHRLPARLPSRV